MQTKGQKPMTKIAIVLLSPQYIRSWIDSGLVDDLISGGDVDCTIFAPKHIIERINDFKSVEKVLISSIEPSRSSTNLVAMSWVASRKRSSTFRFALTRTFRTDYRFFVFGNGLQSFWDQSKRNLKTICFNAFKKRLVILYSIKPIRVVRTMLYRRLEVQQHLPKEIVSGGFHLMVIPCHAVDELITDYLSSARNIGLKSLVAIDNWDNLTSKSVFVVQPDYLTVMGKRCIEHAAEIHSIDRSKVLPYGLPRFDTYRKDLPSREESEFDSTVEILYVGFSIPHAEIAVVNSLWNGLKDRFPNQKIRFIYRPHPIPIPRIDGVTEVEAGIRTTEHGKLDRTNMPKMDEEYLSSMINADVVIGAPTTMMFEAMLLERPCIIDGTSDQFHRTNAASAIRNYTHMRDLLSVSNLPIANEADEILEHIGSLIEKKVQFVNYEMEHLYDKGDRTYSVQLKEFLTEMRNGN